MQKALLGTSVEALVIAKLTALGCEIFLPFGHSGEIDFILITPDNQVKRIQVKKVSIHKKHQYRGRTLRQSGNGGRKRYANIDYFIFYADGKFWIVPFAECANQFSYGLNSRECFLEAWDLILGQENEKKREELPLLQ